MIENQEELRVAQEKIRVLKEEIDVLRSQKAELESQTSGGSDAENSVQIQELQNQARLHLYTQTIHRVNLQAHQVKPSPFNMNVSSYQHKITDFANVW